MGRRRPGEAPRDGQQQEHLVHGFAVRLEVGVERRPLARVQRAQGVESRHLAGRRRVVAWFGRGRSLDAARETQQAGPETRGGRFRGLLQPTRDPGDGQALEPGELDGEPFERRQRPERRAQTRRVAGAGFVGDSPSGRFGQAQRRGVFRPRAGRNAAAGRVVGNGGRRLTGRVGAQTLDGANARRREQPVGVRRFRARTAAGLGPGRGEDLPHDRLGGSGLAGDPHRQRVRRPGVPVVQRRERSGGVGFKPRRGVAVTRWPRVW